MDPLIAIRPLVHWWSAAWKSVESVSPSCGYFACTEKIRIIYKSKSNKLDQGEERAKTMLTPWQLFASCERGW